MKRHVWVAVVAIGFLVCGCSNSRSLFNGKDLTGWTEVGSTGAWTVNDGVLHCNGQKDAYAWLSTNAKYSDFELSLEFQVEPGTNSGVFLRVPAHGVRASMEGIEAQIKDDHADKDFSDVSGAVFGRISASGIYTKPVGQWNCYRIRLVGRHLRIELNGHLCSETMIDSVVPRNEGDKPLSETAAEGFIGLQNHGQPVSFRNIRIREIE